MNREEIRNKFIELIGVDAIKYIEENNWIEYEIKPYHIYEVNEIDIEFLKNSGAGDTEIHHTLSYNLDNKTWTSENCIDYPNIEHKSFMDMEKHIDSIGHRILQNGFEYIDLPNIL
jgi:hypothetical protein